MKKISPDWRTVKSIGGTSVVQFNGVIYYSPDQSFYTPGYVVWVTSSAHAGKLGAGRPSYVNVYENSYSEECENWLELKSQKDLEKDLKKNMKTSHSNDRISAAIDSLLMNYQQHINSLKKECDKTECMVATVKRHREFLTSMDDKQYSAFIEFIDSLNEVD